ncbi:MAG: hypothetical protein AAGD35_06185 [Actinomycetota bacterium]
MLAALVVWFEDRREEQRVDREVQRNDRAARIAWQRELDFRLLSIIHGALGRRRYGYRTALRRLSEIGADTSQNRPKPWRPEKVEVFDSIHDVEDLLLLVKDSGSLESPFSRWREALAGLDEGPGPQEPRAVPAPEVLAERLVDEATAWRLLLDASATFLNDRYPDEG